MKLYLGFHTNRRENLLVFDFKINTLVSYEQSTINKDFAIMATSFDYFNNLTKL